MCDLVAVMSAGRLLTVVPPTGLRAFADGGDVLLYRVPDDLSRADLRRLGDVEGVRSCGGPTTACGLVVRRRRA